jgi:hypothetical protein
MLEIIMNNNQSKNFIDVIEDSIGRPLIKEELLNYPLKNKELENLSVKLNDFSRHYKLPIKKETELRPSISPRLDNIDELGFNYVRRIHESKNFEGGFTREIKKYLLYCHGLVIEDPLLYLLDYFRGDSSNSPHAMERIPVINSLILEYSNISELIRSNIIFPVSEPFYTENEVPYPKDDLINELHNRIKGNSYNTSNVASFIFREQFRKLKFLNNVDSFYPSHHHVEVLKEIMKIQQMKFTSDEIISPFSTNVIGNISLLDLENISVKDICYMREKEELFSDWRDFLNSTFKNLYHHSSDYTNLDEEFLSSVRNDFANLGSKVNNKLSKATSNFSLKDIGKSMSIGVVSGVASGIITSDFHTALLTTLITGIISGGMEPTFEAAIDLMKNQSNRKEKKVIQNHFLALGLST